MTTEPPRPPAMMCGTAARMVFHCPVRLMSIISSHTASSISSVGAGAEMPALARTMSRRPSSVTPPPTASVPRPDPGYHLGCDDPAIERLDLPHLLGEVLWRRHRVGHCLGLTADVYRDDVGALGGERKRMAAPLPPCRSGDERNLAVQLAYRCLLWFEPHAVSVTITFWV